MSYRPFSNTLARIAGVAVVAMVLVFKLWHQQSSPDDLQWFLYPVKCVVSFIENAPTRYVDGTGYYFPSLSIMIDKSCAGVNFFLITFGLLSLVALAQCRRNSQLPGALAASTSIAFALTTFVNVIRIDGAIRLREFEGHVSWLGAPWFHEAYGAFVYMLVLAGIYIAFHKLTKPLAIKS